MANKIKLYDGDRVGGVRGRTIVQMPFTEFAPSLSGEAATSMYYLEILLDRLTEHQRNVVLANLLAKYGEIHQRGEK